MRSRRRMGSITVLSVGLALLVGSPAHALDVSVGPRGINARGLGRTGSGIAIGQWEPARPGKSDAAPNDDAANSHASVTPAGVFWRDGNAIANTNIDAHAEKVAGVMISTHAVYGGVAPGASLYASAIGGAATEAQMLLSMQHVVLQNNTQVRALNVSAATDLGSADGSSLLTQFVDWSAGQHDTLYVVAGNETGPSQDLRNPRDNFNGMTVAASDRPAPADDYRRVAGWNRFSADAAGPRTNTDLVAPGDMAHLPEPGMANPFFAGTGTSFAAPHVTGTVALLQEGVPKWTDPGQTQRDDRSRHQVMKAVLMNSADKVEDPGDGRLLGMEKTIVDTNGHHWLQEEAFSDPLRPLDDQMGTGQLNAKRALKQFQAGEHDFQDGGVPLIGWDWARTGGAGGINKYVIDTPLQAGTFISITLAWDRVVTLNDANSNRRYDSGETFNARTLTDMDLYLLPAGAADFNTPICASTSISSPVEHIFCGIPLTGMYEFWIRQVNEIDEDPFRRQFYGVAWWAAVPEPSTVLLFAIGVLGLAACRRRRTR